MERLGYLHKIMNLEKIPVITLTSQAFARLTAQYFGDPTNLFKV